MPLRIAFDLDGVLADMDSELRRQSELLFGKPTSGVPPREGEDAPGPAAIGRSAAVAVEASVPGVVPAKITLTARQQRRLWQHVDGIENFWETLDECEPGAIRRLAAVATERHWEIIFLTKRPRSAGASAQMQTQRWLHSQGFVLPSVFVVQGSRGRIAAALSLDIVVDDTPENCLDVIVDSKARPILVWRGSPAHLPMAAVRLGIHVTGSANECLDFLTQLDSSGPQAATDDEKDTVSSNHAAPSSVRR